MQCPCINCLMFPICKAQIIEYVKKYYNDPTRDNGYTIANVLKSKCSIIRV